MPNQESKNNVRNGFSLILINELDIVYFQFLIIFTVKVKVISDSQEHFLYFLSFKLILVPLVTSTTDADTTSIFLQRGTIESQN